ncbi:MAG: DUF294 nucleotidyltransferase-like domain-containing protein [Candidatus Rokubacteria bacterium]|nr:DUF294 nucleotidyltransferase-like domain-containing protein [Candidatus Rokubacteria bacterium]
MLTEPARTEIGLAGRRIRDLLTAPVVTCPPETSVADAAGLMARRGASSVVVTGADGGVAGIVTDRDLRTKVLAAGRPASAAVSSIMTAPVLAIGPDAPALAGLLEMTRAGIHHLPVIDDGRLVGMISSHDLLQAQGAHPVLVVRRIEAATSFEALAAAVPGVRSVVRGLAQGGAGAGEISRIVAELNDRLVSRAVALVEAELAAEGHGAPPVPYSWCAAGSEGRREQTLNTDQDNGLIYADPPEALRTEANGYFPRLARAVVERLVRLGFPECPGGFMASNTRWCQPASAWRAAFASWMETPEPERVLAAAIYFDLRPVAGDPGPGDGVWRWVCGAAPAHRLFLRFLARDAVERRPPLGFFGRFAVARSGPHAGRLDLKARAVLPMTQAMRAYALSLGARDTNTLDRLTAAGAHGALGATEVRDLRDAYEVIGRVRLGHQLALLDAGLPPDNFIDPAGLGRADRVLLAEAFRTLGSLQRRVEDRFQTSGIG